MTGSGAGDDNQRDRPVVTDDPHGWAEFWDLWSSGRWEPDTRSWMAEVLHPGSIFVDIGAWIGPTALWAVELGASVIAIEPDPVALPELFRRCSGLPVEIWAGAVSVAGGPIRLGVNPKTGGAFGDSMSRVVGEGGTDVASWTLADILHGRTPDAVKIDVEGYETALVPAIIDDLAAATVPLRISCHGELIPLALFDSYPSVHYPADTWGEIVAGATGSG